MHTKRRNEGRGSGESMEKELNQGSIPNLNRREHQQTKKTADPTNGTEWNERNRTKKIKTQTKRAQKITTTTTQRARKKVKCRIGEIRNLKNSLLKYENESAK